MIARYRVNQLNRVHGSLVTASLDRVIVGQPLDGALGMPATIRLEYHAPDDAPAIGAVIVVTAHAERSEGKAIRVGPKVDA